MIHDMIWYDIKAPQSRSGYDTFMTYCEAHLCDNQSQLIVIHQRGNSPLTLIQSIFALPIVLVVACIETDAGPMHAHRR